jgi:CubicO group peptidase (beta-lactamase class C family)
MFRKSTNPNTNLRVADERNSGIRVEDNPILSSSKGDMRARLTLSASVLIALSINLSWSTQMQKAEVARSEFQGPILWSPAEASKLGMDLAALKAIYSDLDRDPHRDLKGIVIVRDGRLVSEQYFNGDSADTLHDIRSATKSLTSLLMGIAIQKGLVHSIDDSIALYLPGLPKDGKEKITIEDLLTMRSGLDAYDDDASSPGNENTLDASSDWIRTVYAVPMKLA